MPQNRAMSSQAAGGTGQCNTYTYIDGRVAVQGVYKRVEDRHAHEPRIDNEFRNKQELELPLEAVQTLSASVAHENGPLVPGDESDSRT